MKTGKKVAVIVAVALMMIGAGIFCADAAVHQFDFGRMSNMSFETKTYEVTQPFSAVRVEDVSYDVQLVPSSDGRCRVVCRDSKQLIHTVEVVENTLTVRYTDSRRWYEFLGFSFGQELTVTVYLPQADYEQLYVRTVSGGISVEAPLSFAEATLNSVSGGIAFAGKSGNLTAECTSGALAVSGMDGGAVRLKTISGGISLFDAAVDSLSAGTVSGGIRLRSLQVAGAAELHTVSGGIRFDGADAGSLSVHTTSGGVTGTLLSGKNFTTHTTSGGVQVPPSDSTAGACDITTVSGEIRLTVAG